MNNSILTDSSFLGALFNRTDANHTRARQFIETYTQQILVPEVTLSEVSFLMNREGGIPAVGIFLASLHKLRPTLQTLTWDDLARARTIMLAYARAELDFVDCCIMAMSERLDIRQIATFDRRDFVIFRPTHCEYLELLP